MAPDVGSWTGDAREEAGLSVRRLARRTGIPKRRLVTIERGESAPTEDELRLLRTACGISAPVPPPDAATRQVLEEYVAMVAELRNTTPERFGPIRQEDIAVLASAFGDPPELVEARITQLLATRAAARERAESTVGDTPGDAPGDTSCA